LNKIVQRVMKGYYHLSAGLKSRAIRKKVNGRVTDLGYLYRLFGEI